MSDNDYHMSYRETGIEKLIGAVAFVGFVVAAVLL